MKILNQKEKTSWIKTAHFFAFAIFVFGVFSFYVMNVYSYEGGSINSTDCTDFQDNDSDGYIDIADIECIGAPGVPNMTSDTDTGSSNTDNITSNAAPDFIVTCDYADFLVRLMNGQVGEAVQLLEASCVGSIASFTGINLSEGVHPHIHSVFYSNEQGQSNTTSSYLSVTIDATAPTVSSVSSNKANGSYTVGEVIDIDVTFSEAVTSTGNVTVTLETGATDRTCTFTVSGSTTGTCDYTVQEGDTTSDLTVSSISGTIADTAGNAMSNFAPVTNLAANKALVIDTTAPTTSGAPDMTSGTDSGSSSTDDITSDTTPTFTGACTDGNTVQLFDDGVSSGSSATCASSVFSLTTGTLAEGSNSITFKETDTVGNVSTASTALVVTIDTTSPTISEVTAVPAGTNTTPDYTFTTNEVGTISYGGSCESITTSASSGSNTITLTTLAVGTYSDCTITVTDSAGNASTPLSITSFTISAPAAEVVVESSNLSGSASTARRAATQTNNDTPRLPACEGGALYNIYTGLPCQTTEPIIPGCFTGFSFSTLTGESCKTTTTETPSVPTTPNTPPAPINLNKYIFTKDIPFGVTFSDDAKQLQIFLNNNGFIIAESGAGSPGKETRYFGPATRTALIKFQTTYNISPAIGYFGPKTRALVNSL